MLKKNSKILSLVLALVDWSTFILVNKQTEITALCQRNFIRCQAVQ